MSFDGNRIIDETKLKDLCAKGLSLRLIAQELGVSRQAVDQYIKRHNIFRNTKPEITYNKTIVPDNVVNSMIEDYIKGASLQQAAYNHDVKTAIAARCFKEYEKKNGVILKDIKSARYDKKILKMYKNGQGMIKISKNLGLSTGFVVKRLKVNDIETRKSRAIDKSVVDTIVEKAKSGESVYDISMQLGVNSCTVRKYMKQYDVPGANKRSKLSVDDKKRIVEMWLDGKSYKQIADDMNVSNNLVWKICRAQKVDMKKQQ